VRFKKKTSNEAERMGTTAMLLAKFASHEWFI
jgi:hypothetical protein